MVPSAKIRGNWHKLEHSRFPLSTRKHLSAVGVMEHRQRYCRVSCLETFKSHLDVALVNPL